MAAEGDRGLREAMRWLLLPVPVGGEDAAVNAAREALGRLGIDIADAPLWIEVGLADWRESEAADKSFSGVVQSYIEASGDDIGRRLGASYFSLHKRLKGQPNFNHDIASALLSHARLMDLLAREERLSASQIANLIAARDRRVPLSWIQVQMILRETKLAPAIRMDAVENVYQVDEALEIELFADADERVCAEMVASAGKQLGFEGDLLHALVTLLPTDRVPFGPYLQMLHYQCSIAEYYDHSLQSIYEFTPRGKAPRWLLDKYPAALEVAKENPFLNNAKGVDQLNDAWARRRNEDQTLQAHALVSIIQGLDSMGYAAKRELAAWLRRLLVRRIRLADEIQVPLPESLGTSHVEALFEMIAAAETHTRGILEQRVVDAVAILRHPSPQWIARGLLDSVNATNVSSLKCGDCDFQDTSARRVVAYEAHGGKLTEIYLEGHLRSLGAVLPRRAREWEENLGSADNWKLDVTFVAHDFYLAAPIQQDIAGVAVTVNAISFSSFISEVDASDQRVLESLNTYIRNPLAEARTPNSVREALLKAIEPTTN